MSRALPLAALCLALGPGLPAGAGMITSDGMAPYEICGLCHGLNGVSAMAKFPKLAGQPAPYLEKQLRDFRSGARANDGGQMVAIVGEGGELAEADIATVAAWFASQPPPPPAEADAASAQGAQLYGALGCGTCHEVSEPGTPLLAAQHQGYLAKQMRDFRDGARENTAQEAKRIAMAGLSDEAIEALSSYLAQTPRSK